MIPKDYQIELAKKAHSIISTKMMVYIAMEERTGKTLIAILTAELLNSVSTVNVITTKKAVLGWVDTLAKYDTKKIFNVTNYHQADKLPQSDLLILDEAHNYISSYPTTKSIWKKVSKISGGIPIIYMSATPHAECISQLYHQFSLSSWSPWREFKNFYVWYKAHGKIERKWVGQRLIIKYKKIDKHVRENVEDIFIVKTRKQLGFNYEPVDKVHYIKLDEITMSVSHKISVRKVLDFKCGTLVADTAAKLNHALYCIEGGTLILDGVSHVLENTEKVDYILKTWGDTTDVVIMYNYRGEFTKLSKYFKNAQLLQATSFAEGIELSHVRHLIIYSQDYRVSKHTQRRARQASYNRKEPINVNFLLVKNFMSSKVYEAVVLKKTNFVDSMYKIN